MRRKVNVATSDFKFDIIPKTGRLCFSHIYPYLGVLSYYYSSTHPDREPLIVLVARVPHPTDNSNTMSHTECYVTC